MLSILREAILFRLEKLFYVTFNLLYLLIISKVTKFNVIFRFPKIESGFNVYLEGKARLDLGNISSRRNLNIVICNGELIFGEDCFFNNDCSINCLDKVTIGKDTIFGENVKIYDHDHVVDDNYLVNKNNFVTAPVSIGENCWIGSNVTILKGVHISDRVIIGANAVVHKSIMEAGIYVNRNGQLTKVK
ncbi:acyltransferase [Shewanella algae]